MTPIKFEESNKVLTRPGSMTDEECGNLHVFCDGQICVSCWQMSWKERLKTLFSGKVWLLIWSGNTQPPVCIVSNNPITTTTPGEKK